jgi:hypothetical protein
VDTRQAELAASVAIAAARYGTPINARTIPLLFLLGELESGELPRIISRLAETAGQQMISFEDFIQDLEGEEKENAGRNLMHIAVSHALFSLLQFSLYELGKENTDLSLPRLETLKKLLAHGGKVLVETTHELQEAS